MLIDRSSKLYYTVSGIEMGWACGAYGSGGGGCIGSDKRGANRVFLEKPDGKKHLEDLGIDGSIILKRIFQTRKGGRA